MSGVWLWLIPLLPAAGGVLLLVIPLVVPSPPARSAMDAVRPSPHPTTWDRLAFPVALMLALTTVVLSGLAWAARPTVELDWLPHGGGFLALSLSSHGSAALLSSLVAAMTLVVVFYAQGYVSRQDARARFFGFLCLFLGAMQWLVLADDLLTLLMGWELVGLCSYALIGFWYTESQRVIPANRAFLTTRFADLGLYLAVFAAFAAHGDLGFDTLAQASPWRDLVAAGLAVAALGKSAQLPFTGWLSGAMQGPTPVSALLHSATMVAAGVVLLIKAHPLLAAVPWVADTLLWLGVAGAITAGLIALYQDEFKQVLAGSTVSQYGYMFAALGAGGVAAGGAHLINHAAFKGLLFLCAGVLVHQGLKHLHPMGGLYRIVPRMSLMALVAALALASLPPFGGFFSKEWLLEAVGHRSPTADWLLIATGFLTAAYATRGWLAVHAGRPRSERAMELHEPNRWMWPPMVLLSLMVIALGLLYAPPLRQAWGQWLDTEPLPALPWTKAAIAVALILAGMGWSLWHHYANPSYAKPPPDTRGRLRGGSFAWACRHWLGLVTLLDAIGRGMVGLGRVLDRLEHARPGGSLGRLIPKGSRWVRTPPQVLAWSRQRFLDLAALAALLDLRTLSRGVMDGSGRLTVDAARGSYWSDRRLLDGLIRALTGTLDRGAGWLSVVQTGRVYQYYVILAVGMGLLLAYGWLVLGG